MMTETSPAEKRDQQPAPLATGEHPWAARLRVWRKVLALLELLVSAGITVALLQDDRALGWAISTQARFQSSWARALIFSGGLALVYGVAGLPLGFLRGYVLEKKFGLSTQTLRAWLWDLVKGTLLGAVLGGIVVLGLTAIIVRLGSNWWWAAALAATLFGIVLTRVAPQLLIPIFFKMKPLDESRGLVTRFRGLAENTRTPVLGIFEIDLSRRTNAANAAVVGFGASRRALVGDTLLKNFSDDEIEFVLAHELAHHRYHDLWTGVALSSVLSAASLFFAHLVISSATGAQGSIFSATAPGGFNPVVLFWIAVLVTVVGMALKPVSRLVSRRMETRADAFAAATTSKAAEGAAAFRKLGYQNLAVFNPPAWEEFLFYTHPSLGRRIARLKPN